MQNNSFKFKPLKRGFINPNYPSFKTLKPNFYPHINKPNNETNNLASLSQDHSQNNNSRSVFFQTFWKNYSKSYDYEYFLTSPSDSHKINTYLTEEINKIVDDNALLSKENETSNNKIENDNSIELNTKKHDVYYSNNLAKQKKTKGIFKQKIIKPRMPQKNRAEMKEKAEVENKVKAVFQNYQIFENNIEEKEISDY